jgi:hypothetical protein
MKLGQIHYDKIYVKNTFLVVEDVNQDKILKSEGKSRPSQSCPPKTSQISSTPSDVSIGENQRFHTVEVLPSMKDMLRSMKDEKNFRSSMSLQSTSEDSCRHLEDQAENEEPLTTMMIRNIPCRLKKDEILADVDMLGFQGTYDFFYLPQDRRHKSNLGYAFINFKFPADGASFVEKLRGHRFLGNSRSQKLADVFPAIIQGFEKNVAHFYRTGAIRQGGDSRSFFFLDNYQIDWQNGVPSLQE